MKVKIHRIKERKEEQVIIECVEITQEIKDIYSYALAKGTELFGMEEGIFRRFRLDEVCYFEALETRVFAYTRDHVYEVKEKLYQVEEAYEKHHFIRCSKSVVMNLLQLEGISPALNGRFFAHMKNGERLIISRQYVPRLKEIIMGENSMGKEK